ncbi:MAG: hypothetical protein OXN96_15140 [Bryobacterales bacterium]|nr:hypothetical protein [Bryobacterales bacterium]
MAILTTKPVAFFTLAFLRHMHNPCASWINQVERWFGLFTQEAICRGSISSVKELTRRNNALANQYNTEVSPFAWVAIAESIRTKNERLCSSISRTQH